MRARSDYMLGGCIVLAAAVLATREAYEGAMALLPIAREYDGHREVPETPVEPPIFAPSRVYVRGSGSVHGRLLRVLESADRPLTSVELAAAADVPARKVQWAVSHLSRVGKAKWIAPTEELRSFGVKRMWVAAGGEAA